MENVIESIKNYFENNDWKYKYNEQDKIFTTGINMGNILGNIRMVIYINENDYNVYIILNSKAEKKYYSNISEFLHRANYGLRDGNFEMDYRDGEIRYKSFVNFKNIEISEDVVDESIMVGVAMIERYGKGILRIMLGEDNIEECIKNCEVSQKE